MDNPVIAVILAAPRETRGLRASVAAFAAEVANVGDGSGEVIVVHGQNLPSFAAWANALPNVRTRSVTDAALVTECWSVGLRATQAEWAAFSTVVMSPLPGWGAALWAELRRRLAVSPDWVGAGGPILPGLHANATDRAVYLLRHARYHPNVAIRADPPHPGFLPGENALYLRSAIMNLEGRDPNAFWEVPVQTALRKSGKMLLMSNDPQCAVRHEGGERITSLIVQRYVHALRFGADRAAHWSITRRMLAVAASPLIPFLLTLRSWGLLRRTHASCLSHLSALPILFTLAVAWACGEMRGYCTTSPRTTGVQPSIQHPRACARRGAADQNFG